MYRFALFVDGSNLFGALKAMNVEVDDYESLFGYVYREAVAAWHEVTRQTPPAATQMRRVYWYVVGSIDHWNLSLPASQAALRTAFLREKDIKDFWMEVAGRANPGLPPDRLIDKAWQACFDDFSPWYAAKCNTLEGIKRFHQAVRASTDLIRYYRRRALEGRLLEEVC